MGGAVCRNGASDLEYVAVLLILLICLGDAGITQAFPFPYYIARHVKWSPVITLHLGDVLAHDHAAMSLRSADSNKFDPTSIPRFLLSIGLRFATYRRWYRNTWSYLHSTRGDCHKSVAGSLPTVDSRLKAWGLAAQFPQGLWFGN
jgi:hypothetical protein